MYRTFLSILLLCSALCYSQGKGYNFVRAEKDAQKLLVTAPEKGLAKVKEILAQPLLNDTILGKAYYLCGLYYNGKQNDDSLIKYMNKSLGYLEKYPKLKVRTLINLSIGYRNKADFVSAIQTANNALELYQKNKDNVGAAVAYATLAECYHYLQDYKTAVQYLQKAITILKSEQDTTKLPSTQFQLANTLMAMGNEVEAVTLYKECAPALKKAGDFKNYYLSLINLGESLAATKQYKASEDVLAAALAESRTNGTKENTGIIQAQLGSLFQKQEQDNRALEYYKPAVKNLAEAKSAWLAGFAAEYVAILNKQQRYDEALEVVQRTKATGLYKEARQAGRLEFTNAAADTYTALKMEKPAAAEYREALALMDTLHNFKQAIGLQEVQARYKTEIQRQKNMALSANNRVLQGDIKAAKARVWFYIIGGILVVVVILLFLRYYLLKNRLQKEELKTIDAEKDLIEAQYRHEQQLMEAQRALIDENQRELTSGMVRMANYHDSISGIIARCDAQNITKLAEARQELVSLVQQQDYWQEFERRFNSLHPQFGPVLLSRFDKLTKNDLEFCSLLKLKLTNKEIASLLQISHESVITKKYRIKKKMDIAEDEEFDRILMEV